MLSKEDLAKVFVDFLVDYDLSTLIETITLFDALYWNKVIANECK